MVKSYPYLRDIDFLNEIYRQHNRSVYTKMTVLDWQERPIQEVQGKIISASMSVNGDSSVRRTANLTVKVLNSDELYNNIDSIFSINKKIYIETGISNGFRHLNKWKDYPIIWFPFGVMIITNYSLTHDLSGVTVNLNLSDKMSLLNGDAGGTIPASTNFESVDTIGTDGDMTIEYIKIREIIQELVNHFGQEDLNKILVNDVPEKIKQVMKWIGTNPLYLYSADRNRNEVFYTTIAGTQTGFTRRLISNGYDAGYTYTDFTYPGELAAGAGDTVCTVLDKIKETLGNYEYFYDVFGNFVFQEIKNYVNTTEWRTMYNNIINGEDDYLPYAYNTRLNSNLYSIKPDVIVSVSNSPQFNMIKNDFIVWGVRETGTGVKLPCRYHLAIDSRPDTSEALVVPIPICFDTDMYDKIRKCHYLETCLESDGEGGTRGRYSSYAALVGCVPQGMVGKYYPVKNGNKTDVYTWVTDVSAYQTMLSNYKTTETGEETEELEESLVAQPGYVFLPYATYYGTRQFTVRAGGDWRNRLYFEGIIASKNGLDTNYYFQELVTEWPKLYDVENQEYYPDVTNFPTDLDYWLDIIDNNAILNEFCVDNIGRRSYAKTETNCNCVFEPDIPDVVMICTETSDVDPVSKMTIQELQEQGLAYTQIKEAVYDSLTPGGSFNSCYENVRQLLDEYTSYNENVSLTCLPMYHLEPNTRVFLEDEDAGVYGEYLINSISFDLGSGGTMTINAKKIIDKM